MNNFAAIPASSLHELNVAAPNKAADGLILSYTLFVFTNKGTNNENSSMGNLNYFLIPAPGSDSICPAHVLDAVEIRF
ncbi:hypothetical protein ACQX5L_17780 [Salmonella enterica]|uniref:hypothetical protein n=1 Tax=Salmonella enterica TaxID=28901 RepID=UPI003D23925C